ncbi:unnamed protein product, partial [marine sediment metagenome]
KRENLVTCITQFYELGEPGGLQTEFRDRMCTMPLDALKSACLELCGEAINRDMITFVKMGTRGTFGSQLYRTLNQK